MDSGNHPVLGDRETRILERIREGGGFTCTGGCEQRKSGQLHCIHLALELGTSSHRIWKIIGALVDKGLLERRRDEAARCWHVSLTEGGHQIVG